MSSAKVDINSVNKLEDKKVESKEEKEEKVDPDLLTIEDVKEQIRYIEKAVSTKEKHYMSRMIRSLSGIRKKLTHSILKRLAEIYFPQRSTQRKYFFEYIPDKSELKNNTPVVNPKQNPLPEVELYLHLLLLVHLIDTDRKDDALKCSDQLLVHVCEQNKRILDPLAAKCYFFYGQAYYVVHGDKAMENLRSTLNQRLRTCTLKQDVESQAVIINLLLRNYISAHLYDLANKLVCRIVFPEQASNSEWARYLYYLGRINAIRLDYSAANENLQAALRKAPQFKAFGFRQIAQKLKIIVQLLLGELPERALFRIEPFKDALNAYFEVTQAVRVGNLSKFNDVLAKCRNEFIQDDTYTLILRLRHNVIKTGVRRISLSYSRISLGDIAIKLSLDNPEDVEFIVAKAIRDGVINAKINHKKGYLQTMETVDVYSTIEPYIQTNQRIEFCLNIHNQSVKAMRYPNTNANSDGETAEERRERELLELENAKELSEDEFGDL